MRKYRLEEDTHFPNLVTSNVLYSFRAFDNAMDSIRGRAQQTVDGMMDIIGRSSLAMLRLSDEGVTKQNTTVTIKGLRLGTKALVDYRKSVRDASEGLVEGVEYKGRQYACFPPRNREWLEVYLARTVRNVALRIQDFYRGIRLGWNVDQAVQVSINIHRSVFYCMLG